MDVSEIRDWQSLKVWLESLPAQIGEDEARRWAVLISHRAAMRVLPAFWEWRLRDTGLHPELTPLQILRLNLLCSLVVFSSTEISDYTLLVAQSMAGGHVDASPIAGAAIQMAKGIAFYAANAPIISNHPGPDKRPDHSDLAHSINLSVKALADGGILPADSSWQIVRREAAKLVQNLGPVDDSLWPSANPVHTSWDRTRSAVLARGESWRFWIDWYEKALNGEPQDWDLLAKVALIPSRDWDKGAEHVNALITRIVEQHRLANEARSLKAEIGALRAELELLKHRGHNSPPGLVEETETARRQTTIIWAALDEAETELEKPDPNPLVLGGISRTLLAAVKAIGLYCAKLGDTALQAAAKAIGTGGVAYGGYLASQNEQVQDFATALLRFATSLGG